MKKKKQKKNAEEKGKGEDLDDDGEEGKRSSRVEVTKMM